MLPKEYFNITEPYDFIIIIRFFSRRYGMWTTVGSSTSSELCYARLYHVRTYCRQIGFYFYSLRIFLQLLDCRGLVNILEF